MSRKNSLDTQTYRRKFSAEDLDQGGPKAKLSVSSLQSNLLRVSSSLETFVYEGSEPNHCITINVPVVKKVKYLFDLKTWLVFQESIDEEEPCYKIKNLLKRLLSLCGKRNQEDDLWSTSSSSDEEIASKMTYEEIAVYVDTKARFGTYYFIYK